MLNATCPKCGGKFGKPIVKGKKRTCPKCNASIQFSKIRNVSKASFLFLVVIFIAVNELNAWPNDSVEIISVLILVASALIAAKYNQSYELADENKE